MRGQQLPAGWLLFAATPGTPPLARVARSGETLNEPVIGNQAVVDNPAFQPETTLFRRGTSGRFPLLVDQAGHMSLTRLPGPSFGRMR